MVPIPVAAVLEPAPARFGISELPACAAADLSLSFDGLQHDGALMILRNIGTGPPRGCIPAPSCRPSASRPARR